MVDPLTTRNPAAMNPQHLSNILLAAAKLQDVAPAVREVLPVKWSHKHCQTASGPPLRTPQTRLRVLARDCFFIM